MYINIAQHIIKDRVLINQYIICLDPQTGVLSHSIVYKLNYPKSSKDYPKDFRLATAASSNEESTNQISEFKKSKETQTTETNTKKMN